MRWRCDTEKKLQAWLDKLLRVWTSADARSAAQQFLKEVGLTIPEIEKAVEDHITDAVRAMLRRRDKYGFPMFANIEVPNDDGEMEHEYIRDDVMTLEDDKQVMHSIERNIVAEAKKWRLYHSRAEKRYDVQLPMPEFIALIPAEITFDDDEDE